MRLTARLLLAAALLLLALFFLVKNPVFMAGAQRARGGGGADERALRRHVETLASIPGGRDYTNERGLAQAAGYIQAELRTLGWRPQAQSYEVNGRTYTNYSVLVGDRKAPRRVVGAHYDTCGSQPGADDNASGVAGLLELARLWKARTEKSSFALELVFYTLEEPPFFLTEQMGSYVHAKSLRDANVPVEFMLSLEMIGYFSDEPDSQRFPLAALKKLYPSTGNYIALVGRPTDWFLTRQLKARWRAECGFPIESINAPTFIPGIEFSDHASYWKFGYRALMLTDTAFYRNRNYHEKSDTPATLDYRGMAGVVDGVMALLTH